MGHPWGARAAPTSASVRGVGLFGRRKEQTALHSPACLAPQARRLCAAVWLVDQWQLASEEAAAAAEDAGCAAAELLLWRLLAAAVLQGLAAASSRHARLVAALSSSVEPHGPARQPTLDAAAAWLLSSPRALPVAVSDRRVAMALVSASDAARALDTAARAYGALSPEDAAATLFLSDGAPEGGLWSVSEHGGAEGGGEGDYGAAAFGGDGDGACWGGAARNERVYHGMHVRRRGVRARRPALGGGGRRGE